MLRMQRFVLKDRDLGEMTISLCQCWLDVDLISLEGGSRYYILVSIGGGGRELRLFSFWKVEVFGIWKVLKGWPSLFCWYTY